MEKMINSNNNDFVDLSKVFDEYWIFFGNMPFVVENYEKISNYIIKLCGLGSILDIGCGKGELVGELLKLGFDAYGIDISKIAIDYCYQKYPSRISFGSALNIPFDDARFDTVVVKDLLEYLKPEDIVLALTEIYRVSHRNVFLQIRTSNNNNDKWCLINESRDWWERKCFEAGFRKHSGYYNVNDYESLNFDSDQILILLEKVPLKALNKYPLAELALERDLHMDMLRETGSRSDAHVGRYYFSVNYIRPNDTVLDAACGLGYGSHLLIQASACSTVLGVDSSDFAVNYANMNFATDRVKFEKGELPYSLLSIKDNTIDIILSFETLEHVQDPEELLRQFYRILSPGGRLIASVPNDWSDETGLDPNPFHFHVYNIDKLKDQLSAYFDIEHLFVQTADRVKLVGKKCEWAKRPRQLKEIDISNPDFEAEWLLTVVSKSPVNGGSIPYTEKIFSSSEVNIAGNALAFARDYENPWIVKSLISIGLRTENKKLRAKWAQQIIETATPISADRGAALCILAYLVLDNISVIPVNVLMLEIDIYFANCQGTANPNVFRWLVSLRYVQALIFIGIGEREKAGLILDWIIEAPIRSYHCTLFTKSAEASYLRGILLAADGNIDFAQSIWQINFNNIKQQLAQTLSCEYSDLPPDFEIRELSSVLTMLGKLCSCAKHSNAINNRPSLFYNQSNADLLAQHRQLTYEIKNKQNYIFELINDKNWLEDQWQCCLEQLSAKESTLGDLQHSKEWLEIQWSNYQALLIEKENNLVDLQKAKDWLEEQWSNYQVVLNEKDKNLVDLQKAKDWLEEQWSNYQVVLNEKDKNLVDLHKAKDWLEDQWSNYQVLLNDKENYISSLRLANNTLDAQLANTQKGLIELQKGKDWLEEQWQTSQADLSEIRNSFAFRVLRKLKLIKDPLAKYEHKHGK